MAEMHGCFPRPEVGLVGEEKSGMVNDLFSVLIASLKIRFLFRSMNYVDTLYLMFVYVDHCFSFFRSDI
jgi:hypothetical protein